MVENETFYRKLTPLLHVENSGNVSTNSRNLIAFEESRRDNDKIRRVSRNIPAWIGLGPAPPREARGLLLLCICPWMTWGHPCEHILSFVFFPSVLSSPPLFVLFRDTSSACTKKCAFGSFLRFRKTVRWEMRQSRRKKKPSPFGPRVPRWRNEQLR